MNEIDRMKEGYWSVAAQKHLKAFRIDSPNLDEFNSINDAGKCGRLLNAIKGIAAIDEIKKIEKIASTVGIGKMELHKIILPDIELVSSKQIELIKNSLGEIIGLREYIQDRNNIFDIAGKIFEYRNPSNIEMIALNTMNATQKMPYQLDEIINIFSSEYKESDIELSIRFQNQFKLIHLLDKLDKKNPMISNEYIWGCNHEKIALGMSQISFNEKQTLRDLIETVQNHQGIPTELLPEIDSDLLLLANKTGMLCPVKIITSRNLDKEFSFCSSILQTISDTDDLMDDIKLLLASIRFAERYTEISTISHAARFLNALINHDSVGPHPANATDYTLLESRGIVEVRRETKTKFSYSGSHYSKSGYCLKLLKKDVGREALKILQNNIHVDFEEKSIHSHDEIFNTVGSFYSPEENRMNLAASPEVVQEAQNYFMKVLRNEIL